MAPGITEALQSEAWRMFRIIGEFAQGFDCLSEVLPAVTVFGSAVAPVDSDLYRSGVELGTLLGEAGYSAITGGGPGVMEAVNKGAMNAGAHSIGLNIELPLEQHPNPYTTLTITFRYFFVRKVMLVKYSTAFVFMPGAFGTLDELFETVTLVQTTKIRPFPVILIGHDYWKGLLDWLKDRVVGEGLLSTEHHSLLQVVDSPAEAMEIIQKWVARHGTPSDNLVYFGD
jgi:uncharacterized protein (TIGR00730 family)